MGDKAPSTRSGGHPARSPTTLTPAQRRRAIRSHTGCITCRARKVKCDEKRGACLNCERLHLECQKADGTSVKPPKPVRQESPLGEVGVKRKRTFRSCNACRGSKARCSGHKPDCIRCRQRQVACVYEEDAAPQWEKVVHSSRPDSDEAVNGTSTASEPRTPAPEVSIEVPIDSQSSPRQMVTTTTTTASSASMDQAPLSAPLPSRSSIPQGFPPLSRSSSFRVWNADEGPDSLEWLFRQQLPNRQRVRMLVKEYFENVHPLRCLAFIHRPSFIQRLDESTPEDHARNALLHVVCGLGAKFYALQYTSTLKPLSYRQILSAGNQWAKISLSLLFADLGTISVQNLMTAVLLHDHELRIGNFASAFMLTGTMTRMSQALQLNLEYSTDLFHDEPNNGPSVCSKEARRRLMWSCYISDTLIGSGIDQLTLFEEPDLRIQLPCNERNFVLQVPCVTEMLSLGQFLPFVAPELIPPRVIDNIGIVALYVRLVSLRKQVLRYVKRLDTAKAPWLAESEFANLDGALHEWYQQLPPSLQFTRAALYTRRESSQLGAFVLLQCTYNWTTVDLYRIALPKLYRLKLPWVCPDTFCARLQETIFIHAQRCSTVLADASRHGIKTLADTWLPSVAFDGNRLMLYYITQILGLDTDKGQVALNDCMPYCRSNLELLKSMQAMSAMAEQLYPMADEMLKRASSVQQTSRAKDRESGSDIGRRTREATPDDNGPDYVLQPTTVYRMARDSIATQEKHASEKSRPPRVRANNVPGLTSPPVSQSQYPAATRAQPPNFHSWASPSTTPGHTPILANTSNALLQLEPTAPPMHEFDSFFTSTGFDASWQPAETAIGSFEAGGGHLPSWFPAMTDMYADLNFGPWPMGTDMMNGHAGPSLGPSAEP